MTDVLLVTWMAAVGTAVLAPFWRTLGWGLLGVALPIGAASYIAIGLAMLAAGLSFSTVAALTVASAVGLLIAGMGLRAHTVERPTVAIVAIVGTFAAGTALAALHLTRLTVDSIRYLLVANVLETTGSLDLVTSHDVRMRQLVTPMLHASGVVDGAGYSATITPLFAVSGLIAAGWVGNRLLARASMTTATRWMLVAAVGLLLLTTNRFVYHAAYVNGHMFFAVFLLLGAGFAALLVIERDPAWLVVAAAGFAALLPLRPEAGITAAIFLVPFLVDTRLRVRDRWLLLGPLVVVGLLWNGVVWPTRASPTDLGWLGPVRADLVLAAALVTGLAAVVWTPARRIARWGPAMVGAGLAAALGVAAARDAELIRRSLAALGANVAVEGLWGTLWWVFPLLLAAGWVITRSGDPVRLLLVPLPAYGAALLLFAALRDGAFRVGTGDSGSRMLLHVVLVAALAIVAAVSGDHRDDAAAVADPASAEPDHAASAIAAG